ncbi:MAG: hypothetical protein JWN33_354 [Candidatus Saccharibacteria bacterium]|nr:hypothetical protein [Candidatus Saccharibacteria bacterium]
MPKKTLKEKLQDSNEQGARRAILEDLFYDFHSSRRQVYKMNFIRGIFLGFGTVLGGTVLIAILIWLLGLFVDWFPFIGGFIQNVIDAMQSKA